MARKKVVRLPKLVRVKCPNCETLNSLKTSQESLINSFECKACKQTITTPITKCCIICAFSDKKCPASLVMEAKMKGLEIRS